MRSMMGCKMANILYFLLALTSILIILANAYIMESFLTPQFFLRKKYHNSSMVIKSDNGHAITSFLKSGPENIIKILIWQNRHVLRHNFPIGRNQYKNCNLPRNRTCENVVDRSLYNVSEVVLFHGQSINPGDMPRYRSKHHKWGFYEYETPPNIKISPKYRRSFNFSITRDPNADIPITNALKKCHIDEKKLELLRHIKSNLTNGKGDNVAWFVSHCKTQSRRELYAKELSKYIRVDIFGRCGKLKCGNRVNCDTAIIDKHYKFYLSFENSLCGKLNYVTEKLWKILLKPINAIPIVLGGVDYKSFLPNMTYLDVKNFSSPKQLAMHLKQLSANKDLLNEMILRKNAISCETPQIKGICNACKLCDFLHKKRYKAMQIPDIKNEYSTSKLCISPHTYYGGLLKGI